MFYPQASFYPQPNFYPQGSFGGQSNFNTQTGFGALGLQGNPYIPVNAPYGVPQPMPTLAQGLRARFVAASELATLRAADRVATAGDSAASRAATVNASAGIKWIERNIWIEQRFEWRCAARCIAATAA
jgi:hypothetical protein